MENRGRRTPRVSVNINKVLGTLAEVIHNGTVVCCDSLSSVLLAFFKKVNDMKPSTYQLPFDDAVDIWVRHWNGEFQHRIAANYDVNSGRVNEVLKESRHIGSRQAALTKKSA